MDVKPGHCWRCEKTLPARSLSCDRCPKAVYCQDECKQRDKIRHGAVECKMFGLKTCSHCKKTGNLLQCSGCNDAWYCDAACQRKNWTVHKKTCKDIQVAIKAMAPYIASRLNALHAHPDLSNVSLTTMACDFLRLEGNEWAVEPAGETREGVLTHNYHILSVGCDNLRNTVLTIASLPAEYQGKLHITLNDPDPVVMARNVLFLFMLGKFAHDDKLAPSLASIWYSLHISEADYCLIKTSLQSLLEVTSDSLKEFSGGLVAISQRDLIILSDIWRGWLHLQCERKHRFSINLRKQRQAKCVGQSKLIMKQEYLKKLSSKEAASIMEWFQHNIFTPDGCKQEELITFDNPTLTEASETNHAFMFSRTRAGEPLYDWDSLQVKEYAKDRPSCSVMAMYHAYVTHLLEEMKNPFLQKRLHTTILVSSFTEIPQHHQTLKLGNYDRIFTFNLADYVGIPTLLKMFKPLLNITNNNAMMVTQTMRWFHDSPEYYVRNIRDIDQSTLKSKELYQQDTGINLSSKRDEVTHQLEYHYNIQWFTTYLQAYMMAASNSDTALDRIPSFKEAMQCEGMQMRDFRQELNKLVPFQYRLSARILTPLIYTKEEEIFLPAYNRALEWYVLPENKA